MDEVQARRERLKALKQAADIANEDAKEVEPENSNKPNIVLKFRNYAVKDTRIEHEKVAPAQPPEFKEPVIETKPDDQTQDVQELVMGMAPKKANFDLKRDVQPALEKLERRTQRAILEIMREQERERLAREGLADDEQ